MAKRRTYEVYEVDELSDNAKDYAYNRWLAEYNYPWQCENMATLKAFEKLFNIRVYDWKYDGDTCYYRFTSNYSEEEERLCGVQLLKFIINNYWQYLFKPKTYRHEKNQQKQRRSRILVTNH